MDDVTLNPGEKYTNEKESRGLGGKRQTHGGFQVPQPQGARERSIKTAAFTSDYCIYVTSCHVEKPPNKIQALPRRIGKVKYS